MSRRPPSPCSEDGASAAERERILLPIHQICDVDYLFKLVIFGLYGMTCLPIRTTPYTEDWVDLKGIKLHDCDSKLKALYAIDDIVKRIKTSKHDVIPPPLLVDLVEIYKSCIRSSLYFHPVYPDGMSVDEKEGQDQDEVKDGEQAIAMYCHVHLPEQLPINGLKYLAVRFEVGLDPNDDGFGPVGLGPRNENGAEKWEMSLGPMSLMNPTFEGEGVTVDHLWIKKYPDIDGNTVGLGSAPGKVNKKIKPKKGERGHTSGTPPEKGEGDDPVAVEWVLAKAWAYSSIPQDDELVHCFKRVQDIAGWDRGYSQLEKEHEDQLRRQMGRKRKIKGSALRNKAKAETPSESKHGRWSAMTPFSPAPTPPPGSFRAEYDMSLSRRAQSTPCPPRHRPLQR